ncbi:MAG: hypothetical protein HY703_11480 [Gemmatimonadetes bacterium]|nr:hypothetical protein [Gemmatimonadota bacterium]
MRRTCLALLYCSLGGFALAPATRAQAPWRVHVAPRAAVIMTANQLGRGPRLDDGNFLRFGRVGPVVALGISSRVAREGSAWAGRLTLLRALSSEMTATWDCTGSSRPEASVFCPDILIQPEATVAIGAATAGVLYSPPGWHGWVRPFAGLGVGLKRYTFQWQGADGAWGGFSAGSDTHTSFTAQFGLGAEWAWKRMTVVAELEDYLSRSAAMAEQAGGLGRPGGPAPHRSSAGRHLVHDLALSIGASIRVF